MQKLYSGKTKDVFLMEDGNVLLHFKDAVTGTEGRIDSGGNQVIGEVTGKGSASLQTTVHFFNLLKKSGIPTHFIALGKDLGYGSDTMVVKRANLYNLEVICREKAWGSFVRRYGSYIQQGARLPSLVEFTIKDDAREDPLITEDAVVALNILSEGAVKQIKQTTRKATEILREHLSEKGLELIDIKFEFGEVNDKIVIIDEISGDSMRVVKNGKVLLQKELYEEILS